MKKSGEMGTGSIVAPWASCDPQTPISVIVALGADEQVDVPPTPPAGTYFGWSDGTKRSFFEKFDAAVAAYFFVYGQYPSVALVHPDNHHQCVPVNAANENGGIHVVTNSHVSRNVVYLGDDERVVDATTPEVTQ